MLKIYICEDQPEFRKRMHDIVSNHLIMQGYDMEIALSTDDPFRVLDACSEADETGVYFLDVDLKKEINGIQLAEKIRSHDPRGFIIFVTTHAEMTYLTFKYKVEALDYIIKDDINEINSRVKQCLANVVEKYGNSEKQIQKTFSIKLPDRQVVVPLEKILFFETSPVVHKVYMHTTDRQVEFYGQLSELEEQLDNRFIRCHRSFLVNKDNIQEIDRQQKTVIMNNGQTCYYSSRSAKLLKAL